MNRLDGKIALVTGGQSGIGLACATAFEAAGARVFTAQRGDGPVGRTIHADLSDPDAPRGIVDRILTEGGGINILVNNAGVMEEGTVEEMDPEAWSRTIAVNLTAPYLLMRAAMPALRKSKGAIVNIGSIEGLGSNPRHPAYCASKAGLHGLTRAVAIDHGPDGVRCNAVAPGWIDTDLNTAFVENMPDPTAFRAGLSKIHPVGRTGTPDDVAALVVWLSSDAAAFVTGQVWTVDGGRMSKLSLP